MKKYMQYSRSILILLVSFTARCNCFALALSTPPPLHIFVSFSMPHIALQQWMHQACQLGAPLEIRGLIHHSLPQTLQTIRPYLRHDKKTGFVVNPKAFRQYGITQVPAVVVLDPKNPSNWQLIYGNIPLIQALQFVVRHPQNQAVLSNAKALIEAFQSLPRRHKT